MGKKKRIRQQKALAPKDPAYMVRESDMRAHIGRLIEHDPIVQQAIQEGVRLANLAEARKQDRDILTLMFKALNESEGYGRKRLLRFASRFNHLQKYYEDRYSDADLFAMRKHLKEQVGVDVDRINDEVKKFEEEENALNRKA